MAKTDMVPPLIAAQLNYLVSQCPYSVKVEKMWSGCKNPNWLDRFTLLIPYCLDYIKWDVIFNAAYPLAGPDVIFGSEDESFKPYNGKTGRNCLDNWNSKDPKCLSSLVVELRNAYVAYQSKRIEQVDDNRLKFEISTMHSRPGIDMYMSSISDKPEEVKFAVPLLDMDLNKLVAGFNWRHQQKIYLQVIYPVGKKSSTPRLKMVSSPELKSLFSIEEFRLPHWMEGMCMAEYLPNLEEMLGSQIKDAVLSIELRRKLIVALEPLFGRPIEADQVFCRKAVFLASNGTFSFLVFMSFPLQFPKQQPALLFQSAQHFSSLGVPVKSTNLGGYPWSPRWDASEMAARIFDFLADECLNFKKYCTQLNP